jgi:hypothetical protein
MEFDHGFGVVESQQAQFYFKVEHVFFSEGKCGGSATQLSPDQFPAIATALLNVRSEAGPHQPVDSPTQLLAGPNRPKLTLVGDRTS